jgi:plasmid stabilization system protein ParE
MTSKPLRFHPQAEREYLTALAWYRERSLIAAVNFESAFEQAVQRIRDTPERWPIYFHEFRRYILRHFLSALFIRIFLLK